MLGFVFILSTTILMIFKKEVPEESGCVASEESNTLSLLDTYKLMVKLFYISPVRQLAVVLITVKV
jgi:hypothetical protein